MGCGLVMTSLLLNHTSNKHLWFQKSRRATPGDSWRDYYVSSDPTKYGEARIIFKDYEVSNWTYNPIAKSYFWHHFFSHKLYNIQLQQWFRCLSGLQIIDF